MRIQEILTESQLEQLDEGPLDAIGSVAKGAGKLAGKVIGGVAKGVGAVAGAYGGIKKAFGAGKQASTDYIGNVGKGTNVDVGDEDPAAAPAAPAGGGAAAPAAPAGGGAAAPAAPAASTTTPPTAQDINAQGPAGTAPAKAQTGAAGQALAKTTAAVDQQTTDKAGQTVYAQVKANVDKLDKKGKQRILQLLQKSMAVPDPKAAAAPGAGAMGAMAKQLGGAAKPNTMANAPVSKTNTAKPGNPNAAPSGNFDPDTGKPISAAGQAQVKSAADFAASPQGKAIDAKQAAWDAEDKAAAAAAAPAPAATAPMEVPGTGKRTRGASRVPKKVAPSQAEIDADREARMGPTSDSIIRTGNRLAETFQAKIKIHKARLVAEGLQSGAISIFKK
jgi:hypothetical protein